MKVSVFQKIASALVVSLGAIVASLPAQAGNLVNGWNYARDDYSYDGSSPNGYNASSRWDIYGMGYKVIGNDVFVGINSSNSLDGVNYNSKNIGFGALFLDFDYGKTGNNFSTVQGTNSLVGIRFAPNNDFGGASVGVYTGVTGQNIAANNNGYASYNAYTTSAGTSMAGDLASNDSYFAPYINNGGALPLEIKTGTLFAGGNLNYLNQTDLMAIGFPPTINLASTNPNMFGFKFTLPNEYQGRNFLATLGFECSNDLVAVKPVPVPPASAGILAAGALGGWRAARRKKQLKAVAA